MVVFILQSIAVRIEPTSLISKLHDYLWSGKTCKKKYAISATLVKTVSSQSPRLKCSYGKMFIPVIKILVTKTKLLVIGPEPGFSYEYMEICTKKRVMKQDLGIKASRFTGLIWRGPHFDKMFVLHDWNSEGIPRQSLPPHCGGGSVHNRRLVWYPLPHVIVHLPQAPQDDQLTSTKIII